MKEYNTFLENVYSDEFIPDHLEDIGEVNKLIAEKSAWNGSKELNGILIKKSCEHLDCPHTKCEKSIRVGGIEV